ncbi:YihA family ribosome biogenesis GTP-binding protein [bacterium]|nr:YihA family ribosome biogenesis GTP-binding protein [bacterium]
MKINQAEYTSSAVAAAQMPQDDFSEVAFIGRSNVGKSSLLNMLLGRKNLVKTSKKPGKTITINFFKVNSEFYMVDLPGYGFAKRSKTEKAKWRIFIEDYLSTRKELRQIFVLIDARRGVMDIDRAMIEFLEYHRLPYSLIYTKADKLGKNAQRALKKSRTFVTAATTKMGREELWAHILEYL